MFFKTEDRYSRNKGGIQLQAKYKILIGNDRICENCVKDFP